VLTIASRTRAVAMAAALLSATSLLTACDKPLPTITVFSGKTAKTVSAQPKCTVAPTQQCSVDQAKVSELTARGGGQILIDVPEKLADAGWFAAAFSTDSSGKNTPITGAGSQPVTGKHTIALNVPFISGSGGGYLLQIDPIKPNQLLTTWLMAIKLTQ
jgi:hypothetical protein